MIVISLCAEDIKPHLKKNEKNGKHYINLVVDTKKETDQYGNTHTVYVSQSKEQREAKEPKKYVGNGKEYKSQHNAPKQAETKPIETKTEPINEDDLGLPF